LVSRLVQQGVTAIPVAPSESIDALLRSTDPFDVILVLPDPSIFNSANIGHVVRTLYQQRKVLIGYSDTLTRVGSLASVCPSPEGIARGVKTVLEQFPVRRAMPDPVLVSDVDVSLNDRLARSLNIVLPDRADLVRAIRSKREALP
jgi:putative tryptophan/tyrosine transport system substrate-binding protein